MSAVMRILLGCTILFVVCPCLQVFGQAAQPETGKYEFGLTIGPPALVQPVIGMHLGDRHGVRLSGMYYPTEGGGIQAGYFHQLTKAFSLECVAGRASGANGIDLFFDRNGGTWTYVGLVPSVNIKNIYLASSLVWGIENFLGPRLLLQVGYLFRVGK
jgi:hypothetical protein